MCLCLSPPILFPSLCASHSVFMQRKQRVFAFLCVLAIPVMPCTGFAYKVATYFPRQNEVDIWTKREAKTDRGGEVQISSSAFLQACGLITLYLNLIPCCERDTLASPWSIMHFSVSPFNLHAGPTHWHYHLPRKVQGTPDTQSATLHHHHLPHAMLHDTPSPLCCSLTNWFSLNVLYGKKKIPSILTSSVIRYMGCWSGWWVCTNLFLFWFKLWHTPFRGTVM